MIHFYWKWVFALGNIFDISKCDIVSCQSEHNLSYIRPIPQFKIQDFYQGHQKYKIITVLLIFQIIRSCFVSFFLVQNCSFNEVIRFPLKRNLSLYRNWWDCRIKLISLNGSQGKLSATFVFALFFRKPVITEIPKWIFKQIDNFSFFLNV